MKLWSCDNCHVVLPEDRTPCPWCDLPDPTFTGVDPEGLTTEQKRATHRYVQEAGAHENPSLAFKLYYQHVIQPMKRGEKVPEVLERHYLAGFTTALAVAAYARALDVDPGVFAFDGEEQHAAVEDVVQEFYEAGYEGRVVHRDGQQVATMALSKRPESLDAEDLRQALRSLEDGHLCVELTEEQQTKILEAAVETELDLHYGEHEEFGLWVATEPLEEALEGMENPIRDYEAAADAIEKRPEVLARLLLEGDRRFGGPGLAVKAVQELLDRGRVLAVFPEAVWRALVDLLEKADVAHEAGHREIRGHELYWICAPDADLETAVDRFLDAS